MNTGRESGEAHRARGIIGCLSVGFETLTQNWQVVALPVVLDLILWLGPRLSVAPLLQGIAGMFASQASNSPEMTGQFQEAVGLLEQFAEHFNLLSVLGGVPLFHVPSLLARRAPVLGSPLGAPRVVSLSSALTLMLWYGVLALIGLALGFLYLNEIGHQITGDGLGIDGNSEAYNGGDTFAGFSVPAGAGKLLRFLVFALGLTVIGSAVLPLWMLTVAIGTSIAQLLGVLFWVGGVGFLSYAALHLVFVVPSIVVGGRRLLRAIGESVLLSHVNLSSVFGFVLLTVVIYEGLGYAWCLPHSDSWAMLIGILGNAFVATGLTGAMFVFYRDRLLSQGRLMETEE